MSLVSGRARAGVGIAYILASGLSFGTLPIFARLAYRAGLDPASLLLLRFAIAAICMWAIFLCKTCSSRAIRSKARPSSPISSFESSARLTPKSPSATCRVAFTSAAMGAEIADATNVRHAQMTTMAMTKQSAPKA